MPPPTTRQQQALGEHGAQNAPATRAQCDANSGFLLLERCACQHEVGDVRARNEQHQSHGRQKQHERPFQIARQVGAHIHQLRTPPKVLVWKLSLERRRNACQIGLSRFHGHTRFQSCQCASVPAISVRFLCGIHGKRMPCLSAFRKIETGRHHTNHAVLLRVCYDGAVDYRGIAAVASVP